jgi:hypothetical protein
LSNVLIKKHHHHRPVLYQIGIGGSLKPSLNWIGTAKCRIVTIKHHWKHSSLSWSLH